MDLTKRTKLNDQQKVEAGMKFLMKTNFFELDKNDFLATTSYKKALDEANDEFDVVRNITSALIKISKEIKKNKEEIKNMTIMQIAIADFENKTVGEFLKEVSDRYTKAELMNVKISEIICEKADEMLTVSMVNNPKLASSTFQNENFADIKKYYEFLQLEKKIDEEGKSEEQFFDEVVKDIISKMKK